VSLQVLTTPEADSQIREIENWWRRNRTASPDVFADELAATFDILGHAPHIGRLYRIPVPDSRRVLLKGTRYHVYYVPRGDQVIVLAVWHAQRGVGPPLRVS
jgi:plasmid stabilization system protein ParE